MKKGTIILLFMLCLNLASFGIAFTCADGGNHCGQNFNNGVIKFFFDVDSTTDLDATTGLTINQTYEDQIGASLNEKTGVATILTSGAIGFLDVVRMVIGFIALLTPLPFLTVMYSLGLPLLFMMLLLVPIFAMYTLSIIEFIKGGEF